MSVKNDLVIVLIAFLVGCSSIPPETNPIKNDSSLYPDGIKFKDCRECPEMVVIPSGKFLMGSPQGERGRNVDIRNHDEDDTFGPGGSRVEVSINRFALGVYEITHKQFKTFVRDTGYDAGGDCYVALNGSRFWKQHPGGGWDNSGRKTRDESAATCIDWFTTQAFTRWLSLRTGYTYRLPSESEFEYAVRAGTDTPYFFGTNLEDVCRYGNVPDATLNAVSPGRKTVLCDDGYETMAPVGQFDPNPFGIYDMTGNVWEWLQDCYQNSYVEIPRDGTPLIKSECSAYSIRGGSWGYDLASLRSADRSDDPPELRFDGIGFRVARNLTDSAQQYPDWDLSVYENKTHGFSVLYPTSYTRLPANDTRVFSAVAPYQTPRIDVLITEEKDTRSLDAVTSDFRDYILATEGTDIELVSAGNVTLDDGVTAATEIILLWTFSGDGTQMKSISLSAVKKGWRISTVGSVARNERLFDWSDVKRLAYTFRLR